MKYELKEYGFWETIGKGFNIYFDNFLVFFGFSVLFGIPYYYLVNFLQVQASKNAVTESEPLIYLFIKLMGIINVFSIYILIVTAFVVLVASAKLTGKKISLKELLIKYFKKFILLLGLAILQTIIVTIGYFLLIVPGVILSLGLSFSTMVLVLEDRNIIDSLKRSWDLTGGFKNFIFGIDVVFFIGKFIIGLILTYFIFNKLLPETFNENIISYFVDFLSVPIITSSFVVVYYNARIVKEDYDLENLIESFD